MCLSVLCIFTCPSHIISRERRCYTAVFFESSPSVNCCATIPKSYRKVLDGRLALEQGTDLTAGGEVTWAVHVHEVTQVGHPGQVIQVRGAEVFRSNHNGNPQLDVRQGDSFCAVLESWVNGN